MPSHPGNERRRAILEWIRSDGRGDVTELAARLQVAAETVRRDLHVLEDHGYVRRVHGGAFPTDRARASQPRRVLSGSSPDPRVIRWLSIV